MKKIITMMLILTIFLIGCSTQYPEPVIKTNETMKAEGLNGQYDASVCLTKGGTAIKCMDCSDKYYMPCNIATNNVCFC